MKETDPALVRSDIDREISEVLFREFDKPERLAAFARVAEHMTDGFYWVMLSDLYRRSESLYQDQHVLRGLMAANRPCRYMLMSDEERARLARLPARPTIFRGGWLSNLLGWSWTLERGKAKWYANRCPYDGQPLIAKARVLHHHIAAYFGDEGHDEIVVPPEHIHIVAVIPLPRVELDNESILFQKIQSGMPLADEDVGLGMQALVMRKNAAEGAGAGLDKIYAKINRRIAILARWGFDEKVLKLEKLKKFVHKLPEVVEQLEAVGHVTREEGAVKLQT